MSEYVYLGDPLTATGFSGQQCAAVRNVRGKCIRGRNGNMLVSFDGVFVVVQARLLREIKNQY